jgi:FkbM family methyltransferase
MNREGNMRLLWSSNALWANTGYGVQARHLLPRLKALGHEVAQFAWYGLQGATIEAGDIRVYPGYIDPWGLDVITGHIEHFKADLLISLQDIWVLPENYQELVHDGGAKWACWFPIDHDPCPPQVIQQAIMADYAINYSRFGQEAARKLGVDCPYIPHGISDAFLNCTLTKEEAREKLNLPQDVFLATMVAANKDAPSRKAFPEILTAWADFAREHPDAMLYLHTQEKTRDGIDFHELFGALHIDTERVKFCDQYLNAIGAYSEEYLAGLYTASDVLLAASRSEGFGIPIVEAQACGCPVITTDVMSMSELTWNGIATKPAQMQWTPLASWIAVPSVDNIRYAMETIYNWTPFSRTANELIGKRAAKLYSWDRVVEDYWKPFLEQVERDITLERELVPEACIKKGHDWANVGVWYDGLFSCPCKRPECPAENKGGRIVLDGFPMAINGVPLDLKDPIGGVAAKLICREVANEYKLDEIDFEPGDIVLELGAHVGEIACYLGKQYEGLEFILYEAVEENVQHCYRNLSHNGVKASIKHLAVMPSSEPDIIKLGLEDESANSGGYSVLHENGLSAVWAPTVSFLDVVLKATQEADRIKLLIMDIEGAEWEILDKSAHLLESVDHVRLELHHQGTGSLDRARAMIERLAKYVDPGKLVVVNQGLLQN